MLRKVIAEDKKDLWDWRNDPVTVANSFDNRAIPFEEHARWFDKALKDDNRLILIGLEKKKKIGMIRFDNHGDYYEISVNMAPGFRGQGKGNQLLKESLGWVKGRILARVKKENRASIRFFEKAGFIFKKEIDSCAEFETYWPPIKPKIIENLRKI